VLACKTDYIILPNYYVSWVLWYTWHFIDRFIGLCWVDMFVCLPYSIEESKKSRLHRK
jgi:hypothetical protein